MQFGIWNKLRHGVTVEETVHDESVRADVGSFIFLGIPLNSFRIFGFGITPVLGLPLQVVREVVISDSLTTYKDIFTVVTLQVMVSRCKY